MAMIRQADLETSPRRALVLDVENIRAQADRIMEQTRQAAAAMIEEARATRERILDGAAEVGRAKGYAEGLAQGRADGREQGRAEARAEATERLASLEASWAGALREFAARREDLLRECEQRGLDLAILMGQRVAHRMVRVDREAVLPRVGAVVDLAARGSRLRIAVNPADLGLVRDALPGLLALDAAKRHVEIDGDESVPLGSCVARCQGGGTLDARVDAMVGAIVDEILPDAPRDGVAP